MKTGILRSHWGCYKKNTHNYSTHLISGMELDVLLVVLHCLLTDGPDVVELALVKLPGVKHTGVVLPDVGMGIVLGDCKGGLS